jgi:hypothetical protein
LKNQTQPALRESGEVKIMPRKPLKFFHIPKTGGTSIEESARDVGINWGMYDPMIYLESWKTPGSSWHQPLYQAVDESAYRYLIQNYDFFCVVRNPYDKCISEFYCPWNVWAPIKDVSLEYFNMFIQSRIREQPITDHWAPQSLFVYHEGQQIIKHVLKYENLEAEFTQLLLSYGLTIPLQHHNKSEKKYSRKDLEPETIRMIHEFYTDDFSNFGYVQNKL